MKNLIFSIFIFSLTLEVFAYPLFFKCENGRLEDHLSNPELAQKFSQLLTQTKNMDSICQGGALCEREFKELLRMAQVSAGISDQVIAGEIQKLHQAASTRAQALTGLVQVSEGLFKSAQLRSKAIESIALSEECRIASANLDPNMMRGTSEKSGVDFCVLANFQHSPYMYPSGIRFSGNENETGNRVDKRASCDVLDDIIEGALGTDQDPFAAIAISLMENGSAIEGLTLDPIGVVQTLGCSAPRGTAANHNVDSYGNYYNVQWSVKENASFVKNTQNFAKVRGAKLESGSSFVCYGTSLPGTVNTIYVGSSPSTKACCVPVPFTKNSLSNISIEEVLTYSSFDKYLKAPLEPEIDSPDPIEKMARRLQRFNGYSDSMGGTEGVPAWRAGVNFYKTPTYGYQAMDFMLNTLMNNPYVQSKVKAIEEKLHTKTKSILCQDRPSGTFTLDHAEYFKRSANAPRLTAIRARLAAVGSFSKLPRRDQNVLANEYKTVCGNSPAPMPFCSGMASLNELAQEQAKTVSGICMGDDSHVSALLKLHEAQSLKIVGAILTPQTLATYWNVIYPKRATMALANEQDQGFTWREMDDAQFGRFLNQYEKTKSDLLSDEEGSED